MISLYFSQKFEENTKQISQMLQKNSPKPTQLGSTQYPKPSLRAVRIFVLAWLWNVPQAPTHKSPKATAKTNSSPLEANVVRTKIRTARRLTIVQSPHRASAIAAVQKNPHGAGKSHSADSECVCGIYLSYNDVLVRCEYSFCNFEHIRYHSD